MKLDRPLREEPAARATSPELVNVPFVNVLAEAELNVPALVKDEPNVRDPVWLNMPPGLLVTAPEIVPRAFVVPKFVRAPVIVPVVVSVPLLVTEPAHVPALVKIPPTLLIAEPVQVPDDANVPKFLRIPGPNSNISD